MGINVTTKLNEHTTRIETLETVIFGNKDTVGLNEQFRVIKAMLDTLTRLAWIVVGVIITVIVSGTSAAVIYLIREMGSK